MQTQLTINSRGVVTLPAKIRKAMGLQAKGQLIAETTPQGLLLRPTVRCRWRFTRQSACKSLMPQRLNSPR